MRRLIFGISVYFAFLTIHPSALPAQTLAGRLLDASAGTPIALGRVSLADLDGDPVVFTVADTEGFFSLTAPGPGDFWVSAQSLFYWDFADGPVTLSSSDTILVEFRLTPHPTQLDELVVRGEPPESGVWIRLLPQGLPRRHALQLGR